MDWKKGIGLAKVGKTTRVGGSHAQDSSHAQGRVDWSCVWLRLVVHTRKAARVSPRRDSSGDNLPGSDSLVDFDDDGR